MLYQQYLLIACMACFVGLLLTGFFMRLRVLTAYQKLVAHRVQFERQHIFDQALLEAEIFPKYPEHRPLIQRFVSGIRFTLRLASVLITIITVCAAILMFGDFS